MVDRGLSPIDAVGLQVGLDGHRESFPSLLPSSPARSRRGQPRLQTIHRKPWRLQVDIG